ncbi:G-patch domain-containing protein [Aphelenchoides bicaudatus]|nr:G-patch domain-containing protein [Aphelenchoides bicaudatus]
MWQSDDGSGTSNDIAKMIAEAANSFIANEMLPGYVYSPEHNLYYNEKTGYFYDMRTSLYYHPSKGWVQYNPLTGDYDSLTQPEKEPKSKWKSKLFKDEDKKTFDENYDNQNAVDDYVPKSSSAKRRSVSPDYDDERFHNEWLRRKAEEKSKAFPPCIRLIDQTDSNKLYVVTIDGAFLGWSSKCDICLKENDALADEHARIKFIENGEEQYYQIECLRKRHPVFLNNFKVTTKGPAQLEHGMFLVIGPYRFDVHIHNGSNTCSDCEPGILNARLKSMNETYNKMKLQKRQTSHKNELQVLKERMGLNETEEQTTPVVKYKDRAKTRRKLQGSEPNISTPSNIYSECKAEPVEGASSSSVELSSRASMSVSIDSENKGFKLLKMMGWSEDTGLGKQQQGIIDPITASGFKNDKKGLGLAGNHQGQSQFISARDKRRQESLAKTRQRFDQADVL